MMRRLLIVVLVGCVMLPGYASAQPAPKPTAPPAPPPPPEPTATPAASQPADEETRSLFAPTWRQFQLSGRISSIDGDPARFQRYEDVRDGLLFTDARYAREAGDGSWSFQTGADNVGWRDQKYFADYERPGRLVISGLWDSIPQFYSVDTQTPYTTLPDSALDLDDNVQRAIQNGQANLNAYVPIARQFDLTERRDIGHVNVTALATPNVDVTAAFTTTRHVGELPWGASYGFSNDVEVALPYDSRTNDFTVGAEWSNARNMFRVAYNGSWFDNLDDTLVWDSPLRLTDSTTAPGRGRIALWPSNSANTFSASGYAKFARRTQFTGFLSYGIWSNDEPLQPFTINPTLRQIALPRASAAAEAQVLSTNLGLVSRPADDWRFSARLRRYDYDNQTPHTDIPEFINYDTSVKVSSTGGPEPYAHSRTTLSADATWSGLPRFALTAGYAHNASGHEFRIFEDTGENVLTLTADAIGSQYVTFRANYEFADKSGSGLNEALLVQIGEQPQMRHFDIANRTRNRFTGQVDVVPNDTVTLSFSAGFGDDQLDDSYFGLQEAGSRILTAAADFQLPSGFGTGVSYSYERYAGLQTSRSASPGQSPPQENDPNRDWTTDSTERVDYFSIYVRPPRFGRGTETRFSYEYAYARGDYVYGVVPGGPLPPPSQLPQVYNKLQDLRADVRHRITNRVAATFSYRYEPFRVYDFAFDPTVVNGIVQPSSLVLGYVYRPYTAHAATFGLLYFF
jgi:MtrB/PioB family decaheme-associated outer membrane protein